jgi:hypothetical protein
LCIAVNSKVVGLAPATLVNNASDVKIYNATNRKAIFLKKKKYFPYFKKSAVYFNAGVFVANSGVIGLAPVFN